MLIISVKTIKIIDQREGGILGVLYLHKVIAKCS